MFLKDLFNFNMEKAFDNEAFFKQMLKECMYLFHGLSCNSIVRTKCRMFFTRKWKKIEISYIVFLLIQKQAEKTVVRVFLVATSKKLPS